MSLTELLVPTYRQMLRMLGGLLDKAQRQMPGQAEAFLSARLAADMYPLATQLRFAALQAQEAVFRLRGEPGLISDARKRIDEALSLLDGLAPDALDAGAGLPIAIELPGGIAFDMTGERYARDWALPQFYFHVITAYAILRSQGVEIGKADYVPHIFAYLRPGPAAGV